MVAFQEGTELHGVSQLVPRNIIREIKSRGMGRARNVECKGKTVKTTCQNLVEIVW
jgi:hypothetical protein